MLVTSESVKLDHPFSVGNVCAHEIKLFTVGCALIRVRHTIRISLRKLDLALYSNTKYGNSDIKDAQIL